MTVDPRKLGLSQEDLEALGYSVRGGRGKAARAIAREVDPPVGGVGSEVPDPVPAPVPSRGRGGLGGAFGTAALLVLAAWGSSTGRQVLDVVPANQPDTVFSSARAMAQLVDMARAPRPPGSAPHERIRSLLLRRLRDLGLEDGSGTAERIVLAEAGGGVADGTRVENVVARLAGSASTGAVLVTAHYDTDPLAPGAGDGALGVVALLEAIRVLAAGPPLRNDLIVLVADAGTLGALGLRTFLGEHPWMTDVSYAISLENVGGTGASWILGTPDDALGPISAPGAGVRHAVSTSLSSVLPGGAVGPGVSEILAAAGVRGVTLASVGGRGVHRTVFEAADRIDERTLSHQGAQLLSLMRTAGDANLSVRRSPEEPRLRTSVAGVGLVTYPTSWSLWITLALVAAWVTLLRELRRRGASLRALGASIALGALVVSASAGVAHGIRRMLSATHPEFGRVSGAIFAPALPLGALLFAVVGLTLVVYGVGRHKIGQAVLYAGVLGSPLGLLVWTGVAAPPAAVALQLPLCIALAHAWLLGLIFPVRDTGLSLRIVALLFAVAILAVTVPNAEWAAASLWPVSAVTWGALLGLGLLLVLPAMEGLVEGRMWVTPALAAACSVALVGAALPGARGDTRHPELTSLALLLEADETATVLESVVLDAGTRSPAAASSDLARRPRRIAGTWLTVPGTGEQWSRSWAVAGETTPRGSKGLLLPRGDDWVVAGAGPAAELAPPSVELVGVRTDGRTYTLSLEVRSGLDGGITGLRIPERVRGSIRSVQGHPVAGPVALRALRWWGQTRDEPLRVELEVVPDGPVTAMDVIEHHLDPQGVLGPAFFVRDDAVVPDVLTGSDRVVQRTAVRIPLERG